MDPASLFFIHNYHGYILQIFIAEMLFLPLLRRRSRFLLRLLIAFLPFALLSIVLTNLLAMRVNGLASITIFLLSLGLQIAIYESKVKDILFCCVGAMLIQNLSHNIEQLFYLPFKENFNNIGWFFREGRIVGKDLELSTKWFKKSADFQNAYGEYNYGLALHRGEGIKRDDVEAVKYFKRAADGGCVEALNSYGLALLRGEGVEKNELEAIKTFERAAATGFPPAMENLAHCYEKGKGVKPDDKKAMLWRIRSKAARGDRAAQAWLMQNDKERRR